MRNNLPKISIITPSFNQGAYLEDTIKSVLSQRYPNLEYIIMDGGSTDNSVDIIKKYNSQISFWKSEPDNGQSAAIHDGFKKSTGDILAFINSDDYYLPNSFQSVVDIFMRIPTTQWVVGRGIIVDERGNLKKRIKNLPISLNNMAYLDNRVFQPATFWRRELYFSVGGINPKYSFAFDYDLFFRFLKQTSPKNINKEISAFRIHDTSKTMSIYKSIGVKEDEMIRQEFFQRNHLTKNKMYDLFGKIYRKYPRIGSFYNFITYIISVSPFE
jgi:glycosyltransferase involved in cell wall biosynthesis